MQTLSTYGKLRVQWCALVIPVLEGHRSEDPWGLQASQTSQSVSFRVVNPVPENEVEKKLREISDDRLWPHRRVHAHTCTYADTHRENQIMDCTHSTMLNATSRGT